MAVRNILLYPHPTLRAKCKAVEVFDEELHKLLDDMAETMYTANGVGLAAPQIGVDLQVTVIDAGEERGKELIELINPKVVEVEGAPIVGEEGCLSFPDIYAPVERKPTVKVEAQDRNGEAFTVEGDGLLGVALQHEIDHLNGKLFIDYISRFRHNQIRKQMKKRYGKGDLFWTPKPGSN